MPTLMSQLLLLVLAPVAVGTAYLYLLAFGSAVSRRPRAHLDRPGSRFAIAIPAHDEASVIGETVQRLWQLAYPRHLYDVFVVADHCADETADIARKRGAICYERGEGRQGSKGAALAYLFERVLAAEPAYDAVVVFDADTLVDPGFLRAMDTALSQGGAVVQGCHRISNPAAGQFAALTWAMFMIDNRFQNLGRDNLGLSAKHMGDSICFRCDVLRKLGWSSFSLTEDYEFRAHLLLEGMRITYEPTAVGYGEAPPTLAVARRQRARWLRGTAEASRRYLSVLLRQALRRRSLLLLDGAAQMTLPSFSSLALLSAGGLLLQLVICLGRWTVFTTLWSVPLAALLAYPLLGLVLERAPVRAYLALCSAPVYIVWRTWLALSVRLARRAAPWVRTPHGVTR